MHSEADSKIPDRELPESGPRKRMGRIVARRQKGLGLFVFWNLDLDCHELPPNYLRNISLENRNKEEFSNSPVPEGKYGKNPGNITEFGHFPRFGD